MTMRRSFPSARVRGFLAAVALAAVPLAGFAQEPAAAPAPRRETPPAARAAFAPGERLDYQIRWGLITAGNASLSVQLVKEHGGVPAYRFIMTAATTPFLDKIYRVRDCFDSWVSADMAHSLQYRQSQAEGSRQRDLLVTYDPATLTALRIFNHKGNPPLAIQPGTFDPLGAMYAIRSMRELKDGQVVVMPISDGKVNAQGSGRIVGKETITTPAGIFDTLLMEPELAGVKGVFEKSKGAKIRIWFTKDRRHLPVRVSSKVLIGSFTAELVSITPGTNEGSAEARARAGVAAVVPREAPPAP